MDLQHHMQNNNFPLLSLLFGFIQYFTTYGKKYTRIMKEHNYPGYFPSVTPLECKMIIH